MADTLRVTELALKGRVVTAAVVLVLFSAVRDVLRARRTEPVPGPELTAHDAPLLWAELREIAARMGQPPPSRVVVAAEVNAFVTESAGQRELMIGFPLLAGLSRGQLRAVLAHELGHLAAGHTRGSVFLLRVREVLLRTLAGLHPGVARWFVSGYARTHQRISAPVLHDHERESDEWAARIAGADTSASALTQVACLDAAWSLLGEVHLPMSARAGRRASFGSALVEVMQARAEELNRLVLELDPGTSRYDSHPPLRERIAALAALRWPAPADDPLLRQPARRLLGESDRQLEALEDRLLPAGGPRTDWADVMRRAVLADAAQTSGQLIGQLVQQTPGAAPTLRRLLAALADGRGESLISPLLRGDVPRAVWNQVVRKALAEMLTTVLVTAFAQAGRIRVTPDWTAAGPWQLSVVGPDGTAREWPFEAGAIAAAERFGAVEALATALRAEGLDLDAHLEPDVGPVRSIAVAAIALTRTKPRIGRRNARHDLFIYDDGLLTVATAREHLHNFRRSIALVLRPRIRTVRTVERIQEAAEAIGDHPERWAKDPANRAIWFPFDTIQEVRWRPGSDRLRLTMHDGSHRRFLMPEGSLQVGDARTAIENAVR